MKIIVVGFLLLVVVVIGGAKLLGSKSPTAEVSVLPRMTSSSVYTLTVLEPDVMLKGKLDTDFAVIDKSADISEGSEIKTGAKGRALLTYPNGTLITLEANTDIVVKALVGDGSQSRLELVVGDVWSKIKNALGTNEYYEIETQNTVASVRGTIFAMRYHNKISDILVVDHTVKVTPKDTKTGEAHADRAVDVSAEEKVSVDDKKAASATEKLLKRKITDTDWQDQRIQRNLRELSDEDRAKTEIKDLEGRLRKRLLWPLNEVQASPIPEVKDSPHPSVTSSPAVSNTPALATPTPTVKPSVTPQSTVIQSSTGSSPTPTPVATAIPEPTLKSVTPVRVDASVKVDIAINGSNMSKIREVLLGDKSLHFFVVDSFTLFATIPAGHQVGIYDVSVLTTSGVTLTLTKALEVK